MIYKTLEELAEKKGFLLEPTIGMAGGEIGVQIKKKFRNYTDAYEYLMRCTK